MSAEDLQNSDGHIVNVAGHGLNPSPVPPEPEERPSLASGFSAKRARHGKIKGNHISGYQDSDYDSSKSQSKVRTRKLFKTSWKELVAWYLVPILVVIFLRVFILGVYFIPSGSMLDTIHIGDYVVTSKLTPRLFPLNRGDIVVFEDPANWLQGENSSGGIVSGKDLIKRLIGLPGDTVECKGDGDPILVNGIPVLESAYIKPGVSPSSFPFKVKVKPGHVFVLGDNRANSADSRYHKNDGDDGLVPISKVEGVAFMRFWPLNRMGIFENHSDAFDDVRNKSDAK
ncbi:signal peptidase I [Gardnerella vaginalis 1400E]|uniref:Signal peptidase I n=1 Tax=Gardnerella vaginalis 1400E TaxID=698956 RepID=I4LXI0_GARVA|nr:signal peptidase I [Gardnerella vaginalis]EIK81670.1 signal peptidase I [Gardnerella vaginalis 1400E]